MCKSDKFSLPYLHIYFFGSYFVVHRYKQQYNSPTQMNYGTSVLTWIRRVINQIIKIKRRNMNKNKMDNRELNEEQIENLNCQNNENSNCECECNCENQEDETDNLSAQLDELKAKNTELNDQYLRLLADYDNYRKRTLREKSELIKNGGESALTSILPVVDDFERAIANIHSAKDLEAIKEGVELIYGKFISYLNQNNVTAIETEEMPFDTDLHDAITTIPAPAEHLKGKVVDCVQKGYKLNDKVIRFAKVVVGE